MGESENLLFAVAGKDLQTGESLDTVMCYDVESVLSSVLLPQACLFCHFIKKNCVIYKFSFFLVWILISNIITCEAV